MIRKLPTDCSLQLSVGDAISLLERLHSKGIPHAVGGGFAVSAV
jgi:hypothetical protein